MSLLKFIYLSFTYIYSYNHILEYFGYTLQTFLLLKRNETRCEILMKMGHRLINYSKSNMLKQYTLLFDTTKGKTRYQMPHKERQLWFGQLLEPWDS